ncbi:carbohydrate binding domain-containing protein [Nonomuraea sp. NPDC050547]|uniref:carbohydrate binding domain-containing protein n=1 Tax=Nonomuraea sp. NPDC050547 TaxID=3364368 RepID=UPI0037B596D6
MRLLTPLHLPALTTPPAPPAAGHVAIHSRLDGSLQTVDAAGAARRIPAAQRAEIAADYVLGTPGLWETVLTHQVTPGAYRLAFHRRAQVTRGQWQYTRLTGTANAALSPLLLVGMRDSNPYGDLRHNVQLGDVFLGGDDKVASFDELAEGLLVVTTPGNLRVQAALIGFRDEIDFESGGPINHWGQDGADVLDQTDEVTAHGGALSAKLTASGADRAVVYRWWRTEPGIIWTMRGWLYSPTGHPAGTVRLSYYDDGGNNLAYTDDTQPIPAGVWTEVQVSTTAPANAFEVYAHIGMAAEAGHTAGSIIYVDDMAWTASPGVARMLAGTSLQLTPA